MTAVDDALDRLERWACPNADAPGHSGCSYCADHQDALATVRDELQRLREKCERLRKQKLGLQQLTEEYRALLADSPSDDPLFPDKHDDEDSGYGL